MFLIVSALWTQLSWTHYRLLLSSSGNGKLEFYLEEAEKNWTVRQKERQTNSQLYERLLLSSEKDTVLSTTRNEQQPTDPKDIIKDTMILDFLGLKSEVTHFEKDLESALITHLQTLCWSWVTVFHLWHGKKEFISMAR